MRVGYERLAGLDEVLDRARELSARTLIFDIEPLVAYWDSGQAALDRGVAQVVSQVETVFERAGCVLCHEFGASPVGLVPR